MSSASLGRVLVAVTTVRFGDLPNILEQLPRLERVAVEHTKLANQIQFKFGLDIETYHMFMPNNVFVLADSIMESLRVLNPSLHSSLLNASQQAVALPTEVLPFLDVTS